MMSFKCLCETHQCPIIISSKPRQRRRRRDQAASVIARRPQPKPSNLSFFFSLFASRSLCVQELCLVGGVQLTFLPISLSLVPSLLSRLPTSLFPLPSLLFCCPSTLFLLLFLPLPILPPFLPHVPRRCACPHLPVFPRLFSALRCVFLSPAHICFSLPPSLPPSIPASIPL